MVLIASAPPPAIGLSHGLVGMGHEIEALVAIRAPEGRYGAGYPFALHKAAQEADLLFVRSGEHLGALLRAYAPDVALCASFPARIPDDALEAPRYGILNAHPGLLPRYRGPNPMGHALRNGDDQIGLTLHRMTSELDAGPIYAQGTVHLDIHEDLAVDGDEKFGRLAGGLVAEALARIEAGDSGDPQDESDAGYAGVFEPEYREVDWTNPAVEIHRQTRAWKWAPPVNGVRGPLTDLEGRRVRLLRTRLDGERGGTRVMAGDGPLWVLESEPVSDGPEGSGSVI